MKTVYFVRHGESTINAQMHDTWQDSNSPLTDKGIEQARFIAERVKKLNPDALLSSNMARAKETAQHISEATGLSPTFSDLFCERINPTSFVGMHIDDPVSVVLTREWVQTLYTDDRKVQDGENFAELYERAGKAFSFLEERPEERIAVVTHGFFLRMLLARVMFRDELTPQIFKNIAVTIRTDNTGVTIFQFNAQEEMRTDRMPFSGWIMRVWNDHAHLG